MRYCGRLGPQFQFLSTEVNGNFLGFSCYLYLLVTVIRRSQQQDLHAQRFVITIHYLVFNVHRRRHVPHQKSNKKPRYRLDSRLTGKRSRSPDVAYPHSVTLAARRSVLFGVTDEGYYTATVSGLSTLFQSFSEVFSRPAFASASKLLHGTSSVAGRLAFRSTTLRHSDCQYTSLHLDCQPLFEKSFG